MQSGESSDKQVARYAPMSGTLPQIPGTNAGGSGGGGPALYPIQSVCGQSAGLTSGLRDLTRDIYSHPVQPCEPCS